MTETLTIDGMSCGHCVAAVRNALDALEDSGVQVHEVEIGSARITYDADRLDRSKLAEAIDEAGYSLQ